MTIFSLKLATGAGYFSPFACPDDGRQTAFHQNFLKNPYLFLGRPLKGDSWGLIERDKIDLGRDPMEELNQSPSILRSVVDSV